MVLPGMFKRSDPFAHRCIRRVQPRGGQQQGSEGITLLDQRGNKCFVCGMKVFVQRGNEGSHCGVGISAKQQSRRPVLRAIEVGRVQPQAFIEISQRAIKESKYAIVHASPQPGGRVVGVFLNGEIQHAQPLTPIRHTCCNPQNYTAISQHGIRHGKLRVQFYGPLRRFDCQGDVINPITSYPVIGNGLNCGEPFPGAGVVGVECNGLLKQLDGDIYVLAGDKQVASLEVQIIGVEVAGGGFDHDGIAAACTPNWFFSALTMAVAISSWMAKMSTRSRS